MDYQSPLSKNSSRRALIVSGAVGGMATALGLPMIAQKADARTTTSGRNDAKILNNALYYEHQAIWAYGAAAGKLTSTEVGKAVLALALRNQADHKNHRDALAATITSLGGTPVKAKSSYDLSSYIKKGEGNLDSDVNIAKLALALETDAAIAYSQEIAKLKTPKLITIGASIGSTETAHAAAIRATFKALGVNVEIVPAPFLSIENREAWVLKV
ncbi:Tat pathway signal protein [Nostoc sp. 'Peltigera membranacea cyanobiont' 213]|uniref:ferritin-like domain-containing protein n=1 Tax=unclassified Nostoc TaxID=2593658 RepID=UPI000B953C3D|nr:MULTISPECIES: ferritin-like domain-containing protein [unclassified Nostoc]AVH62700.1 ferritin-like domain protein [Nostoc sp. 'Peltigera membranacea cyanobiont' N6]OYD99050.1 Tat pathway signal protein [Nostoc sp. 'Peltigera membranacea cyanobiont' 213]